MTKPLTTIVLLGAGLSTACSVVIKDSALFHPVKARVSPGELAQDTEHVQVKADDGILLDEAGRKRPTSPSSSPGSLWAASPPPR